MEAQRPTWEQCVQLVDISTTDLEDIVSLPPPPEPFPLDLINGGSGIVIDSAVSLFDCRQ